MYTSEAFKLIDGLGSQERLALIEYCENGVVPHLGMLRRLVMSKVVEFIGSGYRPAEGVEEALWAGEKDWNER